MIESRLLREKREVLMEQFVNNLKSKAKIEIIQKNLDKLKVESVPAKPPAAVGGKTK